jgi:hypothetical protein
VGHPKAKKIKIDEFWPLIGQGWGSLSSPFFCFNFFFF